MNVRLSGQASEIASGFGFNVLPGGYVLMDNVREATPGKIRPGYLICTTNGCGIVVTDNYCFIGSKKIKLSDLEITEVYKKDISVL